MNRQRATRFIRTILYDLKRRFGGSVTFHRTTHNKNFYNGTDAIGILAWKFKKVIVLPRNLEQKFVYDLSYIASNKNFTMGAVFDTSSRRVILDVHDAGAYVPELRDYFVVDNKRFDITDIQKFEFNTGFLVIGQQTEGSVPQEAHILNARNRALFSDNVDLEIGP